MARKSGTLILTHSDCDGICAGALALARFPGARVFFTKPVSLLYDLQDVALPSGAGKIIICDIALTKRDATDIVATLSGISRKSEVMYFDHHAMPEAARPDDVKGAVTLCAHDTEASASEIIYSHFQKSLPRERVWLALYGAVGDYTDNSEFAKERMRNWDRRALYFEVSTLILGIKDDAFSTYSAKRRIISALAEGKNPSDVNGLVMAARKAVTREFEMYRQVKRVAKTFGPIGFVKDLHGFGFRGPSALFAATVTEKPIGLSIHTIRSRLDITARTRSKYPIQLNKIMEKAAEAVNGSGGGHPRAAGARIPKGKLKQFLVKVKGMV